MRTIKQIEAEAKPLRDIIGHKDSKIKDVKRAKKQLSFLRFCARYLETAPTEECVKRQYDSIANKISVYEMRFSIWSKERTGSAKQLKQLYEKEFGLTQLKAQLRTVKYLLS